MSYYIKKFPKATANIEETRNDIILSEYVSDFITKRIYEKGNWYDVTYKKSKNKIKEISREIVV